MAEFIYLGMTVMNQNCILEEILIKCGECLLPFSSESLSSHLLSENLKD
jgi:hypothetical protein